MTDDTTDQPVINIVGDRVALGPLRRDLVGHYQRWINDFATARTVSSRPRPWTFEQEIEWFESTSTAEHGAAFTVYERPDWRPIGSTELRDIDYRNRSCEFGILIGEPDARGRGYGTEVARLMLDYAFTALGLHNVMLWVLEYNLAGRRAYERAGFRECGRRRAAHWLNGRWWDMILMNCLADEFQRPVLGTVFVLDEPRNPAGGSS